MNTSHKRVASVVLAMLCGVSVLLSALRNPAQAAPAQQPLVLNELVVNTVGSDPPNEMVEIRGAPGAVLNNVYFVIIESDPPSPPDPVTNVITDNRGIADHVVNLSGVTVGANGLILLAGPFAPWRGGVPAETTTIEYPRFSPPVNPDDPNDPNRGGGIENGANTFLLIQSSIALSETADYDVNSDGQLELPAGAVVLDSVGWQRTNSLGQSSGTVYSPIILTQAAGEPDAATRLPGYDTPLYPGSWYNGDLTDLNTYDPAELSANFPAGGAVSRGAPNLPLPPPPVTSVPTWTPIPSNTPRPTNTPVPLPSDAPPGAPTNTPVPLGTQDVGGTRMLWLPLTIRR